MTKSGLIEKVAELTPHISKKDTEIVVNTIFDSMTEALRQGERIEIRGFGSFQVKLREAREGRNPKTGEEVQIPAKRTPFFKVGKELKEMVDASTGAHLWTETYTRTHREDDPFALQDDLVPRIVSTIADWYGALPHSMSEAVRFKPADQLSSYEAVLRSFVMTLPVVASATKRLMLKTSRSERNATYCPSGLTAGAMLMVPAPVSLASTRRPALSAGVRSLTSGR